MEEQHHAHHIVHHTDSTPKKRISLKKVGIFLGAIVAVIALYLIISSLASSTAVADASNLKLQYTIKTEDGTVIAENTSSFSPGKFGEYFGFASAKIDDEIFKLKEGGKISITLDAEDAFGEYNESYIQAVNRTETLVRFFEVNRTLEQPVAMFNDSFGAEPEIGKSYSMENAPWNYTVTKIDNDTVTISQDAKLGQFIPINDLIYANVTALNSTTIGLLYGADEQTTEVPTGKLDVAVDSKNIYFKLTPEIGNTITLGYFPANVLDFNETDIVLDYNLPYAGEKVIVEVKVVEVTKKKAAAKSSSKSTTTIKTVEGAPTLQTFVMTHCPYGTQMEKGVIPAMKLLNGKANFEIRFVSYTMHGEKEDTETNRQLCIREEQSAKFLDYLECFLEAGDSAGCVDSTGLDSDNLETCMDERAADYYAVDKELNEQYGVQGSPTTVLDGKNVQIYPRSPEDVKKAVCAAFDNPPAECDETLDTANPSAGFGYSTSSSGSAASCG